MRVDLEHKALDVRPGGEPDLLQMGATLNVARPVAEGAERAKMPDIAVDAPSGDRGVRYGVEASGDTGYL